MKEKKGSTMNPGNHYQQVSDNGFGGRCKYRLVFTKENMNKTKKAETTLIKKNVLEQLGEHTTKA